MLQRSKSLATLALLLVCSGVLLDTAKAQSYDNSSCSNVIRDISKNVYDKNFDNFSKVLELRDLLSDTNLQADILIGLFDAMNEVHHLNDPLKAILLYNEVEWLINSNSNLNHLQASDLEKRYILLKYVIIDKGSEILEAGVILNDCNSSNSTVQVLLNELYFSNQTLSDLTVSKMVEKVRWVLPFEELLVAAGNISTHVRQNIDAMIALNNLEPLTGKDQILFIFQLAEMQQDPKYKTTVSAEKKHEVDGLTPAALKHLIGGEVCMNLKLDNGTKLFVQECLHSYRACVYGYANVTRSATLKVVYKQNPLVFNFLSKNFNLRPIHINPLEVTQANGLKYDIYSSIATGVSNDWQIELDGDYLKVHNGTRILCGSSPLAVNGNQWYTYSRSTESYEKYLHECRWTVSNCKGV